MEIKTRRFKRYFICGITGRKIIFIHTKSSINECFVDTNFSIT